MMKCQYCGNEYKNAGVHERYCKQNPSKISKSSSTEHAQKQPGGASEVQDLAAAKSKLGTPDNTKKESFLSRLFKKKKAVIEEVTSPEELIRGLKNYEIKQSDPKTGIGKIFNRDKDFIQVVLVSELIEPKTFWAEKDGLNRIRYKDRMFKLPRDVRGNVFFWHIDKKTPLIDTAEATESDAESSFHELQLFNMAYSVGRAAGANDLMNNLKFILIVCGLVFVVALLTLGYVHLTNGALKTDTEQILNAIQSLNNSIVR